VKAPVVPTPESIPVEQEIPVEAEPVVPPVESGAAGDLPLLEVNQLWQVGSCGSGEVQFDMPRGLAVDESGNVYVADSGNHRIVKLSTEGDVLLAWGSEGEGAGQFVEPFDVVVNAQGEVIVLDAVAHRLQRFGADGEFVAAFGREMAFYRPRGLGIDSLGNLYVADTGGVRLLKLSADGRQLMQIGGADEEIGPGQPTDAAVAPTGTIYLIEAMSGIAWRLNEDGEAVGRWQAAQANTLDSPHVAVGPAGRVYITDPEGGRVLVFAADGEPVGGFGSLGDGPGQFRKPVGIAVGADGTAYVSDSHGCRVLALSSWE
jgi:DNA-binding beta-propeller fold protein YncE